MDIQEVLLGIIGVLVTALATWFWADKRDSAKQIKELEDKLVDVENRLQHFTTQAEVKEMIREYIEPLRQDQREIKLDVKEVITLIGRMAQDLAVINALKGSASGNRTGNR